MSALLTSGPVVPIVLGFLALLLALPGLISFVRSRQDAGDIERPLMQRPGAAPVEAKRGENRLGKAVMGIADNAAPTYGAEVSA
ncbi:MAG: hypothetical protein B7Z22_05620, partial [Hyphomonas sp. 32-62-5]